MDGPMGDERRPIVLVVDDDEDHVTMLELALDAAGYAPITASSCASARDVLMTRDVDALVCDLTLGDGTAIDLVESVGGRVPRVAVVLSGFDSPSDIERTRAAGFHAHLVKPASFSDLTDVLEAHLTRGTSGLMATPRGRGGSRSARRAAR